MLKHNFTWMCSFELQIILLDQSNASFVEIEI